MFTLYLYLLLHFFHTIYIYSTFQVVTYKECGMGEISLHTCRINTRSAREYEAIQVSFLFSNWYSQSLRKFLLIPLHINQCSQCTLTVFSDVFRGQRKGALVTDGLYITRNFKKHPSLYPCGFFSGGDTMLIRNNSVCEGPDDLFKYQMPMKIFFSNFSQNILVNINTNTKNQRKTNRNMQKNCFSVQNLLLQRLHSFEVCHKF